MVAAGGGKAGSVNLPLEYAERPEVKALLSPKDREPAIEEKPKLVTACFAPPGKWVLPIVTVSEANGRDWKKRSARTQQARRIVSKELGCRLDYLAPFARHYHAGRKLRITLVRLGGRKLDAANLGGALKATEDAVALMLGADDGDPRWLVEFAQQPGGLCGVRVEVLET